MTLQEKVKQLVEETVHIVTKNFNVGYAIYNGVIVDVGDDFLVLDNGRKTIIIPLSEISTITIK